MPTRVIEARVLDVGKGQWAKPQVKLPLDNPEMKPGIRLASYAGPDLPAQGAPPSTAVGNATAGPVPAAATQAAKPAKEPGTFLGKKWYTWVIGGVLVAVVVGLVVAQQFGSNDVTVKVSH